jgi:4-hydroxy-tetrahydrodipicolinate synthase
MHAPGLQGIWPALVTPLTPALAVDHTRFAAHARALLAAGCSGVTPFGTTGEGPSFSVRERCDAIDALVAGGVDASRILVSASAAAATDVIAMVRHAQDLGAWGVLLMPPFFFKGVWDAGVSAFFDQVLEATADRPLRVVLYHIPQVSGVALSDDVIAAALLRWPQRIVAIKDSGCERASSLARAAAFMPPDGTGIGVHVGHEPDLPALAAAGSRGAVSGFANFMPHIVHRLATEPDAAKSAADLARVQRLLAWLGGYALIPALKAIVAARYDDPAWLRVRAPLAAIGGAGFDALRRELAAHGLDPSRD